MTFSTDFFTHHGQLSLLSLTIRPEKVSGVKVEVTGSHTLNINFYSCKKRLFTFLAAHGHNFGSISLKFMHMLNILSNTLQRNHEKIFIFVETPGGSMPTLEYFLEKNVSVYLSIYVTHDTVTVFS